MNKLQCVLLGLSFFCLFLSGGALWKSSEVLARYEALPPIESGPAAERRKEQCRKVFAVAQQVDQTINPSVCNY